MSTYFEPPLPLGVWSALPALTLTQLGAVPFTQTYARISAIGKVAHIQIFLSVTGAGTAGNNITVGGLPASAAPAQSGTDVVCGSFVYLQSGITRFAGAVIFASATTLQFQVSSNAGLLGFGPNFAEANGDVLALDIVYELA